MFSGNKIAAVFADRLSSMGMSHSLASGLSQTVIIVIVTYLSIVIGELVPKRIGMNSSEKVAKSNRIFLKNILWQMEIWIM